MKQILKNKAGISVYDVPLPTPGENELLVAVAASAISTGTETAGMRNDRKSIIELLQEKKHTLEKVLQKLKESGLESTLETIKRKMNPSEQALVFSPIGYSNAGTVIAKGRLVKGFNVGDRVACAGSGIAAHAEYVTIPVNLSVRLPNNLNFNEAAFTTIGSIAMQGIRRAEVTFGETIVITGLGLLGLLAVQISKAWGLVVIGLDINPQRLDIAASMGADHCFLANDPDTENHIHELTNGHGADAVIIYAASKSSDPANQAFRICRRKGRVVAVGSIGMDLEREIMYMKELDFVMSTSYGPGRYDNLYEVKGIDYPIAYVRWTENRNMKEFVRLLSSGLVNVVPLISNEFSIEQFGEAFKSLIENPEKNISNLFYYPHENFTVQESKSIINSGEVLSGKIRVGIIGAGGFVQSNHIPNILKFPEKFELVAIANRTPAEAKSVGEKFKVRYVTTDYQQILNDPQIDMVVIGTRHNLHAQQVSDAIRAGKHVLVEKPLAMNMNELSLIQNEYKMNPHVFLSVGFNRRYSPLTKKAKEVLARQVGPMIVNYRINAGFFAPNVWVQDPEEGGGRIIGEVCHFIDFINYLVCSPISNIQVAQVPVNETAIKTQDNISILISYSDGSLGVITYIAIGGKDLAKERIEIFIDKTSMVIDDFKSLVMYNNGEKNINLKHPDKGHLSEIEEFSKLLRGEESLIVPFTADLQTTEITINIVQSLNEQNS